MNPKMQLAYANPAAVRYGEALHPVTCGFDLEIGAGMVFPELNFTLPTMKVSDENMKSILEHYRLMLTSSLDRFIDLKVPGAVIEFEHAPQMTEHTEIGASITNELKSIMTSYFDKHGFRSALRVTVCDIREGERPPLMRSGKGLSRILQAFERNSMQGADLLSIESTGGKEVSDPALMNGDIGGILLALGILAPRDCRMLWKKISKIAAATAAIPAGDTACAFANTAMILADQKYLPSVMAAVVRAMSAVRTLVAHEEGATGPTKDCGYEGTIVKAITGCPISLEGKTSACAHFSHMGNLPMATCDLWSNESVQNVKLLSGYAPEVFAEMLAYDCRMLNTARLHGHSDVLRRILVSSDDSLSVHALVISPDASYRIAEAIAAETQDFGRTRAAGLCACSLIREAISAKALALPAAEHTWLDKIQAQLEHFDSEAYVIDATLEEYGSLYAASEYGLTEN